MVSTTPARDARSAAPAPTGAASRSAVCASRQTARTRAGGGGLEQGRVWGSGRRAAPFGHLACEHDNQHQLCGTRELDVAPAKSAADSQDECLQQRAGVAGKTPLVVAGVLSSSFAA